MHFDDEFQENLWKTLMGILHLGNIEFTKDGESNGRVDENTMMHVDYFCQLMGLQQEGTLFFFCTGRIVFVFQYCQY